MKTGAMYELNIIPTKFVNPSQRGVKLFSADVTKSEPRLIRHNEQESFG